MRPLIALVAMALCATDARAVLIAGRAVATVAVDLSRQDDPAGPAVHRFSPGETMQLSYSFDIAPNDPGVATAIGRLYNIAPASFRLEGAGGVWGGGSVAGLFAEAVASDGSPDRVMFQIGGTSGNIELIWSDPTGRALSSEALPTAAELLRFGGGGLRFGRDHPAGFEGFLAVVVPVAGVGDLPVPEPSTLALGAIGAGVVGLACLRRRKVA